MTLKLTWVLDVSNRIWDFLLDLFWDIDMKTIYNQKSHNFTHPQNVLSINKWMLLMNKLLKLKLFTNLICFTVFCLYAKNTPNAQKCKSESAQMWTWTSKPVISSTSIFVAIANNTLYGSKLLIFSFMPKIIRIFSKDHVPWRYFVNFLP